MSPPIMDMTVGVVAIVSADDQAWIPAYSDDDGWG